VRRRRRIGVRGPERGCRRGKRRRRLLFPSPAFCVGALVGFCIQWVGQGNCALFGEDVVEHLHEDGEVLALIVGGEDDGVLVLGFGTHFVEGSGQLPVLEEPGEDSRELQRVSQIVSRRLLRCEFVA
jgi:hypothetical protein